MKYQLLRLALRAPLLLLCAWPRTSVAQAAIADSVLAWGNNDEGQTTVPVAAQSGVTAIAAGAWHTVALKNDGSVVAWGNNDNSQTTIPLAAQSGVTAIAAGAWHTVALKNDGSVVAWGNNDNSQTTIPLAAQSGVTAIAAGGSHTVALKDDGSVVAWGSSEFGQTRVPVTAQSGVTAIAAGGYHTVALKTDGSVVAWGYNDNGQRSIPLAARSGVTSIAAGRAHTVALKSDGSVVAWGWAGYGLRKIPLAAQSGVTAIAAAGHHTVALKKDGTVVAWGSNNAGQTTVPVAAQSGVTAIAAGADHTGGGHTVALVIPTAPNIITQPVGQAVNEWQSASLTVVATGYPLNYQWRKDGVDLAGATSATYSLPFAQTNQAGSYTVVVSNRLGSVTSAPPAVLTVNPAAASGTVVAWGANYHGQTTIPLAAQSGVTAIAAGGFCAFRGCNTHTVALKNDGSVVAWGYNDYGQVTGTPTTDWPFFGTASPVTLGGQALGGVTAIAAGVWHTVALKNDGTVVAWGRNDYGQVTGTQATDEPYYAIASPVTLEGRVLRGVMAIAGGEEHTVALKNDGSLVAWGNDGWGQTMIPLAAQNGVTAIAAGIRHTVALKNDGSVVSWGSLDQTTVPVAAQSGVTAIAAGSGHTVALKNDGTVVAWGSNGDGQVTGTPTPADPQFAIASPVTLGGQVLSGVAAIAAGVWHTVALKNDGSVVAWGDNHAGQVTGTPTNDFNSSAIASPVTLGGRVLSGVTAIAAGTFQTVALIGGVHPPVVPIRQLIVNGGFEDPDTPTYIQINPGQNTIAPWVVGEHSVEVGDAVGNGFITGPAFEGAQFLDLNGLQRGRLTQAFATTPGSLYTLTFAYTDNYWEPSPPASARVRVFDGLGDRLNQTITHTGAGPGNYHWTVFAGQFIALQNTTSLEFTSSSDTNGAGGGIMLDAVQVFEDALKIDSITRIGNGSVLLKVLGFPNGLHRIQASVDLSAGSFVDLATVTADAAGLFQFQDTRTGLTKTFYRVVFQR